MRSTAIRAGGGAGVPGRRRRARCRGLERVARQDGRQGRRAEQADLRGAARTRRGEAICRIAAQPRRMPRCCRSPHAAAGSSSWRTGSRCGSIDPMTPTLLETIASPADLRALPKADLRAARARAARVPAAIGLADRRAPVVEPRHGRAHDRAALRVRHAARPAGVGRRSPDLRAQDPDRPPCRDVEAAAVGRSLGVSAPLGERVRHVRHRAQLDVDLRRARHGARARSSRARSGASSR